MYFSWISELDYEVTPAKPVRARIKTHPDAGFFWIRINDLSSNLKLALILT